MPSAPSTSRVSSSHAPITWRPTKIMHMRDLSKDDDFLSHLLVEKLGTGTVPLLVHKMDGSRRLPKTDTHDLMRIVRRLVGSKGILQQVVRQAVDELLELPSIRYYLKSFSQKQINAFATHASRYFELYHPSGSIEIAHTSRYSHHTGKSELCILATRNLAPGSVVTELKGSMANLTDEEDKELKRTDMRNCDIRRDFSVIHSKSMKKNHLFLGPARFVNHDCNNNCELFREGRYITFRVLRPIAIGEEITAHYGDGYFGKKNRHCLCETCEKTGRGGYSPDHQDDEPESSSDSDSNSDSDSDSDSDSSSSDSSSDDAGKPTSNINERRTRRGVYAITKPSEDDSDDSNDEDDDKIPSADGLADNAIELGAEMDTGSGLTSLAPSMPPSDGASPAAIASTPCLSTPARVQPRYSSSLTELTSTTNCPTPKSNQSTPFRSIISTRRQSVRALHPDAGASVSSASTPFIDASPAPAPRRLTRSVSSLLTEKRTLKGKGKAKGTPTPIATPRSGRFSKSVGKDETKIKKEEVDARVLRIRPSAVVVEPPKEDPKPDIPRGPDGKPLPTCSTCKNVLPLIAVDSKVVWGLSTDSGKKKKNAKQDCPRCMRHFAIYQIPWPARVAPRGTISITPREETPEVITKKVTEKGLSVLDRKLAAAAASASSVSTSKFKKSRKHQRQEAEEEPEPRPSKRRKSETALVLQKTKVTRTYSSSAKRSFRRPSSEPIEDLSPIRKRGRPRLSLPRRTTKPQVKIEEPAPESEKSALSQPRSINGRFGKKDKAQRGRDGSQSVSGSSSQQGREQNSDGEPDESRRAQRALARHKRSCENLEELEDAPRRKATKLDPQAPAQKVLPRPISGFRGGRLFSKPNPLQYALHAWAGPVVLDDSSSSDDEKQPETPEDAQSLAASIATPEEDTHLFVPSPPAFIPRGPLTYKPSPMAFAKNRWNGTLASAKKILQQPYAADSEVADVPSTHSEGSLSPRSTGYPQSISSDEGAFPRRLRHTYPTLHPAAVSDPYIPKSSAFPSLNTECTPAFFKAGWNDPDLSDASEP